MADAETYRDWQARTKAASKILADPKLKPWQKVHLAGAAYAGLELSSLQSKHRHRFLQRVSKLNAILAKYEIQSFDDYADMTSSDLQQMLATIRTLACPKN